MSVSRHQEPLQEVKLPAAPRGRSHSRADWHRAVFLHMDTGRRWPSGTDGLVAIEACFLRTLSSERSKIKPPNPAAQEGNFWENRTGQVLRPVSLWIFLNSQQHIGSFSNGPPASPRLSSPFCVHRGRQHGSSTGLWGEGCHQGVGDRMSVRVHACVHTNPARSLTRPGAAARAAHRRTVCRARRWRICKYSHFLCTKKRHQLYFQAWREPFPMCRER